MFVQVEACHAPGEHDLAVLSTSQSLWKVLLPRVKLGPDQQHYFDQTSSSIRVQESVGPITHLRLTMYPDGGISRIRAWGRPS